MPSPPSSTSPRTVRRQLRSFERGSYGQPRGANAQDEVVVGDPCCYRHHREADKRRNEDEQRQLFTDRNPHLRYPHWAASVPARPIAISHPSILPPRSVLAPRSPLADARAVRPAARERGRVAKKVARTGLESHNHHPALNVVASPRHRGDGRRRSVDCSQESNPGEHDGAVGKRQVELRAKSMQATPLCGGRSPRRFLSRSANPAESVAEEQHAAFTQRCSVRCTGLGDARRVENLLMQGCVTVRPRFGKSHSLTSPAIARLDMRRNRSHNRLLHRTVHRGLPSAKHVLLHTFRSSMPSAIVKLE